MKKIILFLMITTLLFCTTACDLPQNQNTPNITQGTTTAPTEGHTHTYTSAQTKAPKCDAEGEMTYTCGCGETYTEAIATIEHTWSEWSVTVQPTFTAVGESSRTCEVCEHTETNEVAKITLEEELKRLAGKTYTLPAFQSADELNAWTLFDWVRMQAGYVSSDWNDKTYQVTNVYSLDAFHSVTQQYFGQTYDFVAFANEREDFTYDAEKKQLIWVTYGAGGGYITAMDSFDQIDDTHYSVRYYAADYDEVPVYYGVLNLELTDNGFRILSHTNEK